MDELITKIQEIDFSFLIGVSIELLILAGTYWAIHNLKPKWKTLAILVISVFVIRIIAFQNPLAWYIYYHTLDPNVIGWRQSSVLYDKLSQYKEYDDIEYLAVGSSQTGAIYSLAADTIPNFMVKSLAGLGPVDLYMYRYVLLNYKPEKILLYLSDFDMGRKPNLNAVKLAPSQGIHAPEVYFNLLNHFQGDSARMPVKEMIVGEFFPEYKYSFIFKGYKDQLFNKNNIFSTSAEQMSPKEHQEYQLMRLQEVIDKQNLDINFEYLNQFLAFCKEYNISVLIIEGQYHPDGYSHKNLSLRALVRNKMRATEQRYENVTFFEDSKVMIFEASDYADAYHVKQKAGKKFTQKVMTLLHNLQAHIK